MWGSRVRVPDKLRSLTLKQLHEGHLGVVKMKTLARSYVWWPKMDSAIEELKKKNALAVTSHKILRQQHLYIHGNCLPSHGNVYMSTFVDHS